MKAWLLGVVLLALGSTTARAKDIQTFDFRQWTVETPIDGKTALITIGRQHYAGNGGNLRRVKPADFGDLVTRFNQAIGRKRGGSRAMGPGISQRSAHGPGGSYQTGLVSTNINTPGAAMTSNRSLVRAVRLRARAR
jgi:hypothetical protein